MMVDTWDAVFAFVAAALITWALVPPAEKLARQVGAIDEPGPRSQHTVSTPRMSGIAILAIGAGGVDVSAQQAQSFTCQRI